MYDDLRMSERRTFLKQTVGTACALGLGSELIRVLGAGQARAAVVDEGGGIITAPARHYRKEEHKAVTCRRLPSPAATPLTEHNGRTHTAC